MSLKLIIGASAFAFISQAATTKDVYPEPGVEEGEECPADAFILTCICRPDIEDCTCSPGYEVIDTAAANCGEEYVEELEEASAKIDDDANGLA